MVEAFTRILAGMADVEALRRLRAEGVPSMLSGPPGTAKTSLVEAPFPDLITVVGDGDPCGCCDAGMLPGLGLDGRAVPRSGWGGAPRAARIAAGLAELEAARVARERERRGRGGVPGCGARRDRAARAGPGRRRRRGRAAAAGAGRRRPGCQIAAWEQAAACGRKPRGQRPSGDVKAVRKAREQLAAAAAGGLGQARRRRPGPMEGLIDGAAG